MIVIPSIIFLHLSRKQVSVCDPLDGNGVCLQFLEKRGLITLSFYVIFGAQFGAERNENISRMYHSFVLDSQCSSRSRPGEGSWPPDGHQRESDCPQHWVLAPRRFRSKVSE